MYAIFYFNKCIYKRSKHYSVNKIMPGANCAVFGCGTCRNEKDVGIFTLPNLNKDDFYRKWNRDMFNIITKDLIITPAFKYRREQSTYM